MDITISFESGVALMRDTQTGATAICSHRTSKPGSLTFTALAWFDSFDDAFAVIAAADALGVNVESLYRRKGQHGEGEPQEASPEAVEGPSPDEPGVDLHGEVAGGPEREPDRPSSEHVSGGRPLHGDSP